MHPLHIANLSKHGGKANNVQQHITTAHPMQNSQFDLAAATFTAPVKRIFDTQGTANFQHSIALVRLKAYINRYVALVQGQPLDSTLPLKSDTVRSVTDILGRFSALIDATPPFPGPRRYGNLACRDWHDKLNASIIHEITQLLAQAGKLSGTDTPADTAMCLEVAYYLQNCFGSKTRLDYGTGHELSFVAFIATLDMLDMLTDLQPSDLLTLFDTYYSLIRKLILTYTLEPAGSHGVWGLDDHFHFIYILGASQWAGMTTEVKPRDMLNRTVLQRYEKSNFYCQALQFIFHVKSGPFNEHSPILYDIASNVKHWTKVLSGLMKMYNDEVFKKFPVVQHFWFGTGFFPWVNYNTQKPLPVYENATDPHEDATESVLHHMNIDNDISTESVRPTPGPGLPTYHTALHSSPFIRTPPPNIINNTSMASTRTGRMNRGPMGPPQSRSISHLIVSPRHSRSLSPLSRTKPNADMYPDLKR